MPKFAANISMMFQEFPFLDRFQAAADAGFEAVEYLFPYDYSPDEIARCLSRSGLKQALFNMPPGDWEKGERGLAALPGRQQEFLASVSEAIEYGSIIGTPWLHMMAGIAPSSCQASASAYHDALQRAADMTGKAGIGLVIEPINSRDMPGYFLNDFDKALDILKNIGRSDVRLQFDIYHRQIIHGDVIMGLRNMMPYIGHIQIAAVPERHEPGTGELDDARIFAELDVLEYTGYVGCEYRPKAGTVEGLGWMMG